MQIVECSTKRQIGFIDCYLLNSALSQKKTKFHSWFSLSDSTLLHFFLPVFTIDFLHFEAHLSCSVRLARRGGISSSNLTGFTQ